MQAFLDYVVKGLVNHPEAVTVTPVTFKTLPQWDDFTGRLEAVDSVALRPRVAGEITAVAFEDGAHVHKGQLLFQIDRGPYAAALAQEDAAPIRTEELGTGASE